MKLELQLGAQGLQWEEVGRIGQLIGGQLYFISSCSVVFSPSTSESTLLTNNSNDSTYSHVVGESLSSGRAPTPRPLPAASEVRPDSRPLPAV